MNNYTLPRRLTAEFLGTAFLLAAVVGSGIMGDSLAAGNDGIALLANTISTGAILVILIMMFGPISGAHFNPAVTLAFLTKRDLTIGLAVLYVVAQILGALAGTMTAHFMFELPLIQESAKLRTGESQWGAEIVATFGLVATIFACVRFRIEAVPYAVGLYITSAYWFTASTSFANPAVTIARSFTDTFSGIYPAHMPAFIAAQLIGAVLAVFVFSWLLKSEN